MGGTSITGVGLGSVPNYTTQQLQKLISLMPNRFFAGFTEASLTTDAITITHNLQNKYVSVFVYDNTDEMVLPDHIRVLDENSVLITLTSFTPIAGEWSVIVQG